jgi:N-methylhydantoinase A/oxoprolinase/acetone carboxylase beta subunit
MIVELQEVVSGNGVYTDDFGRKSNSSASFMRVITVNTEHVVSIEPAREKLVEGISDKPVSMCRVVTTKGTHTVVGNRGELTERLFEDKKKKVLKG